MFCPLLQSYIYSLARQFHGRGLARQHTGPLYQTTVISWQGIRLIVLSRSNISGCLLSNPVRILALPSRFTKRLINHQISVAITLITMSKLVSFLKSFYDSPTYRCLVLGLDGSGKTTALYRMALGIAVTTIPTIGFNCKNTSFP